MTSVAVIMFSSCTWRTGSRKVPEGSRKQSRKEIIVGGGDGGVGGGDRHLAARPRKVLADAFVVGQIERQLPHEHPPAAARGGGARGRYIFIYFCDYIKLTKRLPTCAWRLRSEPVAKGSRGGDTHASA